jgi:tetratricopeptide (TPR) repeat protein
MTPERWVEVGRLFHAAQELAPEERQAFLSEQCNGDSELRAEVESLLSSLDEAESFLESPIVGSLRTDIAVRQAGPYELLEEIGHGGMGVVYRAVRRDQGFERFVALKLVKRGMDTDFILRRFESERRILAGLDHSNIARVLDGGSTEDGLPYFVMELIEGRNLLDYCREKGLAVSGRLGLFRQICAAVQYAHQRLVIHRDIKPSNILVTSDGVPRLLDFGLAKVLARDPGEDVERTQTALRLLTPEYASPEQIRGEPLTTASDVYSLGVVLYELLTGERPYRLKTRSPEEVSDAVLKQEPVRPSTRARLDRDLDSIVMMALRKQPSRRYASAEQLSEDIRRHLERLPVKARPDSFGYRARKFVGRHRLGMAATALVLASLAAGLAVSLYQRDRARLEAAKAQQVSTFLKSLFESSFPRQAAGEKRTAQDLLDAGAARVEKELAHQPEVEASMLALLGSVYVEMGLLRKAEPLLERSLELREKFPGKGGGDLAETLRELGRLKGHQADYRTAEILLRRALRIREALPPSPALAETLSELGGTLKGMGRLTDARDLLQRAVSVEQNTGGANLHKWLTNLAAIESDLGDYGRAQELLERALAIAGGAEGKSGFQVDVTLADLAWILREREEYARALSIYQKYEAIENRMYGEGHDVYGMGEMGELYFAVGDYGRAHELLARSIESGERTSCSRARSSRASVSWGPTTPDSPRRCAIRVACCWRKGNRARPCQFRSARSRFKRRVSATRIIPRSRKTSCRLPPSETGWTVPPRRSRSCAAPSRSSAGRWVPDIRPWCRRSLRSGARFWIRGAPGRLGRIWSKRRRSPGAGCRSGIRGASGRRTLYARFHLRQNPTSSGTPERARADGSGAAGATTAAGLERS